MRIMRLIFLWVCALAVVHSGQRAAAATRPNVILIVTDDQGYGDMACHGNPWLKTPNLDRLHADSVCLEDYHVDPICTPTRAALMTGRSCIRVGAWTVTEGRQLLNADEKTMGDLFTTSGYRTAMIGKWHLGDAFPYAPQYRGFQEVVCHRAGGVDEIGNPAGNGFFDDTYFRNGTAEKFNGYCTDIWFNETLRFIRSDGHPEKIKPFFIYLPCNAMHSPFTVAETYWRRLAALGVPEERAKFYGMIENFDENLGRLLDALRDWGLERDTIVIFMGDNGTAAGTTGGRRADDGFNAGMRGKKGSVYEGGHRVGCLVRWPARFTAGRKVTQLTAHLDWLPTLIELCGLTAPAGVQYDGRSITPLLDGKPGSWPARTLYVDRQANQLKLGALTPQTNAGALPQFAVLTEQWRLVNAELYDIAADPGQKRNIAGQHPEVVKRLYAAYQEWFAEVTTHRGADTRFVIGAEKENPTTFTVRDWHPTEGQVIWRPDQLADDNLYINGLWAVQVARAGRYAIRLSRFPEDASKPMGAREAELRLGEANLIQAITPAADGVTFELDLKEGPAMLQTWLKDAGSGRSRGAYYIMCRWLKP